MFRLLGRWIFRAFISMAACFVITYAGDWTVFHVRGSPTATVTVERYMGIPLKGKKEEYDYLGPVTVSCAVSLFPQNGQDPCWHLRQHPEQWQNL